MARSEREAAKDAPSWTFLDRGLIGAAVALEYLTGEPIERTLQADHYHVRVFLTPPWPNIYSTDAERRLGLVEARAEYERLATAYPRLGYEVVVLPRVPVSRRADLVLMALTPSHA
jgi:predicted ATPase